MRRLRLVILAAAALVLAWSAWRRGGPAPTVETESGIEITADERDLIEGIQRAGIDFFWREANPENGLVKDRAHYREETPLEYAPCSIASVGFGLSAIVVACDRGWIGRDEAYDRVLRTLRFFSKVQRVHGFFYHLLDMRTGLRTWKSELSPIDTTLFLAGALHAGAYFRGTEVDRLSRELYEAVDWAWMMDGGRTLALGWTPEEGFLPHRWDHYSEAMLMYLLAIGSIVFTPRESIDFAKNLRATRPDLWGRYGFADAFNDDKRWRSTEVLGIDVGTEVLMIENFLTGRVWEVFMTVPEVRRAMRLVGFREGRKEFDYSDRIYDFFLSPIEARPRATIPRRAAPPTIDGDPADWAGPPQIVLDPRTNLENGSIQSGHDAHAEIRLAWDAECLYLLAVVRDDELVAHKSASEIFLDDSIEVFIDPAGDHLQWGSPKDFQIGLAPPAATEGGAGGPARRWAWFQGHDGRDGVRLESRIREDDYVLEAAIRWSFLGLAPRPGLSFGFTPALNDRDVSNVAKLTWFFHEPGIILGEVALEGEG